MSTYLEEVVGKSAMLTVGVSLEGELLGTRLPTVAGCGLVRWVVLLLVGASVWE